MVPLPLSTYEKRGFVLRRELIADGVPSETIRRWVAKGHLRARGNGLYLLPSRSESASMAQRRADYLLECQAVLFALPGAYLVGTSALTAHGIPTLAWPTKIEVSRTNRVRTTCQRVVTRRPWSGANLKHYDGLAVQDVAHAVVQHAASCGLREGLVAADAALHGGAARAQLDTALDEFGKRVGVGFARRALELADGRTESPGESLLRLICMTNGIEIVPQAEVRDVDGWFVARVDFLVRGSRVVLEFDGLGKYGEDGDIRAEKEREIRLQRCGFTVLRFTWRDLDEPVRTVSHIRAALEACK